jgi:hypothetical protein
LEPIDSGRDPGFAQAPSEEERDVLRALVGVMDQTSFASAPGHRHLERLDSVAAYIDGVIR